MITPLRTLGACGPYPSHEVGALRFPPPNAIKDVSTVCRTDRTQPRGKTRLVAASRRRHCTLRRSHLLRCPRRRAAPLEPPSQQAMATDAPDERGTTSTVRHLRAQGRDAEEGEQAARQGNHLPKAPPTIAAFARAASAGSPSRVSAGSLSHPCRVACLLRPTAAEQRNSGRRGRRAHELSHAGAGRQCVQVLTGDVRNAGTPCGASVVLVGTDGKSKAIALGDSADTGACPPPRLARATAHEQSPEPHGALHAPMGPLPAVDRVADPTKCIRVAWHGTCLPWVVADTFPSSTWSVFLWCASECAQHPRQSSPAPGSHLASVKAWPLHPTACRDERIVLYGPFGHSRMRTWAGGELGGGLSAGTTLLTSSNTHARWGLVGRVQHGRAGGL